ncbi:MAG: hypothetical protein FWB97_07055 [Oscillospiraceae bacterium]|nr:hypothetical protein [Oscillospiraceae bacterium]
MNESISRIKNLTVGELVKGEWDDSYTIVRNGHDLGVFVRVGQKYRFRDNQNNTWVCQCSDIDTGADCIEDAVAFMSY